MNQLEKESFRWKVAYFNKICC